MVTQYQRRDERPDGVCEVWWLTGFCKFGVRCWNNHPPTEAGAGGRISKPVTKSFEEFQINQALAAAQEEQRHHTKGKKPTKKGQEVFVRCRVPDGRPNITQTHGGCIKGYVQGAVCGRVRGRSGECGD